MPAPLAMPSRVTSFEAPDARDSAPARTRNRAEAIFGRVSVVIMACAKSRAPRTLSDRASISSGNFRANFVVGQRNANNAGRGRENFGRRDAKNFRGLAANSFASRDARAPSRAVGVARIHNQRANRPPVAASAARPTSTGAATTRFVVKSAAAAAPPAVSASAKSGRPLTFMPAASAEKENPRGSKIVSGERRSFEGLMPAESYTPSWRVGAESQTRAVLRESSPLHRSSPGADIESSLCEFCREGRCAAPP